MKNFVKVWKTLLLAFAVCFMFAAFANPASAKTVNANVSIAKAGTVKLGTTTVAAPKGKKGSYDHVNVKFKAPSTATYKITFSDIVSNGGKDKALGNFYVMKNGKYGSEYIQVKTEGGKASLLHTKTKVYYDVKETGKKVDQYLKTRSATLKLNKNQVVYLNTWLTSNAKYTYKVNIKKLK